MPDDPGPLTGTLLAFDFGHRRIGVAVGQTITGSANALAVVAVSRQPDWLAITRLIEEWRPVALIVGLPLAADGGATDMSNDARGFGGGLARRYDIPVLYEDERMTSMGADERFSAARAQGGMRKKDAAMKDALAAQIILENWLRNNP